MRRRAIAAALSLAIPMVVSAPLAVRANARAETEESRVADILQSTLVAHGGEVNRCFERALADSLDVAGKIELAVDVGSDGRVTKAAPALDEVKSPILLACLQEAAVTWTMAGIEPGSTVIVPLAFEGQPNQFSIKVKDAPEHGPGVLPGKRRPGARPPVAPFSVKLLVDEGTMHARKAALTELTLAPASRIAMHKHPGAELLYLRRGHARVLGPSGVPPAKLEDGSAIFIPPGMPHAIENMGRQAPVVLLDVFAPMGPERVFRDPRDEAGRAAFEVIRRGGRAPAGARFVVASPADAQALTVFGGKGRARPLIEPAKTGDDDVYLGLLEAEPGAEVPRNAHPGSAEILFVLEGRGELTVGSEKVPFSANEALHIPEGQPHAARFGGGEKTVMLQIFAPAGPEDRYRAGRSGPANAKKPSP